MIAAALSVGQRLDAHVPRKQIGALCAALALYFLERDVTDDEDEAEARAHLLRAFELLAPLEDATGVDLRAYAGARILCALEPEQRRGLAGQLPITPDQAEQLASLTDPAELQALLETIAP